jgi:6-phosphogluconolactonase
MQTYSVSKLFSILVGACGAAAFALIGPLAQARTPAQAGKTDVLVYIGTYTTGKSKGIYTSRLDAAAGTLSTPQLAGESSNPSFLAVHPTRAFLYSVNEIGNFEGKTSGAVSAFGVDRDSGALTPLNQQSSVGGGPAHLVVDAAGKNVLVANYGGGSVAVLPIGEDGRLKPSSAFVQHTGSSINPERQKQPHAHSINLDPSNRAAYVADLGLDKVLIYRYDGTKGSLVVNDPPFAAVKPGAGPRHLAFHPSGRFAYVINELHMTVTVFARDPASGGLTELQTISTLPAGQDVVKGYSTAEVQVHPSGKFLYGSNRGHDSITVFAIDEAGKLTYLQTEPTQGSTPRGFGIDPSGAYLLAANQRSDSVVVFRIDPKTGRLTATGSRIEVGSPVCVKFVPAKKE